jgi:uncharacterized protein (DUF1330 family)
MPAYVVAHVRVKNPEAYDAYRRRSPEVIAQFGGRFLIRGGEAEVLDGDWSVPRVVVIEFPDVAAARGFYNSPEYQEILPLRLANTEGALAILPGVE